MATNRATSTAAESTREALLEEIKDARARTLLRNWTDKYCAISDTLDDLKSKQDEIKTTQIEPLRLKLGLAKVTAEDWYIARRPGRSSLDKEKLKRYLFENGVSMELILEAVKVATSEGAPFTEIRRRKQNDNGTGKGEAR